MYLLRNMPLKQCYLGGVHFPNCSTRLCRIGYFRWRRTTPRQGVFFGDDGTVKGDSVKIVFRKAGKRCSKVIWLSLSRNLLFKKVIWTSHFGTLESDFVHLRFFVFLDFFPQKCFNDPIPHSDGFRVTFCWELSRAFLSQHRLKLPVAIASWQKIIQPFTVLPRGRVGLFLFRELPKTGILFFLGDFLGIVPWGMVNHHHQSMVFQIQEKWPKRIRGMKYYA